MTRKQRIILKHFDKAIQELQYSRTESESLTRNLVLRLKVILKQKRVRGMKQFIEYLDSCSNNEVIDKMNAVHKVNNFLSYVK